MDPETQTRIQVAAQDQSGDDLVIILGSASAEGAAIYAQTVTTGDPTWAGPLAGVSLRLPVYHICESEIKSEVPPEVYAEAVGTMEVALEVDEIVEMVRAARAGEAGQG